MDIKWDRYKSLLIREAVYEYVVRFTGAWRGVRVGVSDDKIEYE